MNYGKFFCCVVVVAAIQLAGLSGFSASRGLIGDVNGDNAINSTDYSLMKRYLLGVISEFPVSDYMWAADANGDEHINSTDYALLKRYILGTIDKFPKDTSPTASPQDTPHPTQTPLPEATPVKTEEYPDWRSERSSYATFTGSGFSGGTAMLDPIPLDMEITALNPEDYNAYNINAALAGAYLEVSGEKGSTVVRVVDLYPEGAPGALDLCPTSFGKLGEMAAGKIDIKWHIVAAPVEGNVSYRIKEGSSMSWVAVQVRNHRYPVLKMEYEKDGQWVNMEKMHWNHFVGENFDTTTPKIRMTDIRGYILTDIIDSIPGFNDPQPAYIVPGNVQFPE